jgi:hypothetical protein
MAMLSIALRRELRGETWRVLLVAALGPIVAGYAVMAAAIAVTVSLASRASAAPQAVLAAAGPGWLAAWHIPLTVRGAELGVLPLGASALMVWLVAASAARAATRLRIETPKAALPIILAVAISHAATGWLIATAWWGAAVRVSPGVALAGCSVFAAVAAAVGLARRAGLWRTLESALLPVYRRGITGAGVGLMGMLGVGALVYAGSLLSSASSAGELLSDLAPGLGGAVGVVLLCAGYLPNVIVGAMSFTVGAGLHVGALALTPFSYTPGDLPGIPLLAALPAQRAEWWPCLMLLPLAAGAGLGWYLRNADPSPLSRLRAVVPAALLAAFGAGALGLLAGGSLGGGELSTVGVPPAILAGAVFGWLAVPGAVVAYLAGPREHGHLSGEWREAPARLVATIKGWCGRSGR